MNGRKEIRTKFGTGGGGRRVKGDCKKNKTGSSLIGVCNTKLDFAEKADVLRNHNSGTYW